MEELGQVRRAETQALLSEPVRLYKKPGPTTENGLFLSRASAVGHTQTAVITATVSTQVLQIEAEVFLQTLNATRAD